MIPSQLLDLHADLIDSHASFFSSGFATVWGTQMVVFYRWHPYNPRPSSIGNGRVSVLRVASHELLQKLRMRGNLALS
jgi:hypothetical protein